MCEKVRSSAFVGANVGVNGGRGRIAAYAHASERDEVVLSSSVMSVEVWQT